MGLSVAQWQGLPWWEQRFLIEMQTQDDTRDAAIAVWREENAKRQQRGLRPQPFRDPTADPAEQGGQGQASEPVRLGDYLRRKQAERSAEDTSRSPFVVTEV